MKYIPAIPAHNDNVAKNSKGDIFKALAQITAGIILIYFLLGFSVDLLIKLELKSFNQFVDSIFSGIGENLKDNNCPAQTELQRIASELSATLPTEYKNLKINLSNNSEVNALATPGNQIIVFKGLISEATSENELSMIIAHEIGHHINQDIIRNLGRVLPLTFIAFLISGDQSGGQELLFNAINLGNLRYSRSQELAADRKGLEILNNYYGHVAGAEDFFARSQEDEQESLIVSFLNTHPTGANRIAQIRELISKNGYKLEKLKELSPIFKSDDSYKGCEASLSILEG